MLPPPPAPRGGVPFTRATPTCGNSTGYTILDNAARTRQVICELTCDHDGDHAMGTMRWPQARWLDITELPRELRELVDCIPVLHRKGKTTPEILKFLATVFTDEYELVEIDPERTLREILELKAELRADLELEDRPFRRWPPGPAPKMATPRA